MLAVQIDLKNQAEIIWGKDAKFSYKPASKSNMNEAHPMTCGEFLN